MNAESEYIKDARGIPVRIGPCDRVVSLVPSLTDTVFGLGAGAQLIGRTNYCTEPKGVARTVPTFGGTKNPDVAGIIATAPDLVLACVEENKIEHLAALGDAGVPVFAVMPRSLDDVAGLLQDFGRLLGKGDAAGRSLSDLATARLEAGRFRAEHPTPLQTATLIWKKPWMAAGGGTHINAMLTELGLVNILAERKDYFEISLEDLAQRELDLVFLPDEPFPFTHHDSWSMAAAGVVASRKHAVLLDGKLLSWYGTRTARSLRTLTKLISNLTSAK